MPKITFNGQIIDVETGEETQFAGWTAAQVRSHIATMRDGDEFVIHAQAQYDWSTVAPVPKPPF